MAGGPAKGVGNGGAGAGHTPPGTGVREPGSACRLPSAIPGLPLRPVLNRLQDLALSALNRLAADTASRVGGGIGVLGWWLGVRRRVANANIARCLGLRGPARARVMRRAYASMGAAFLEVWTIGGPAGPERAVRVLNPRWQALVQRRHPAAIFITPHLGNWDMGAHILTRHTREVAVYAKAQHNAGLDRRLNAIRAIAGLRVVLLKPGDRSGAVQALRCLRGGGILGMLADQKPHDGSPARFLGVPTRCHDGPAFFARKAGVPIVPGVSVRIRAGVCAVLMGRPRAVPADQAAGVQVTMDLMSAMIAAFPGQYFWQHRRFPEEAIDLPPRPAEPWRAAGLRLLTAARD